MVGKAGGTCVAGVFTNGERNGLFRFDASGGSGRFEGAGYGDDLGGTWSGGGDWSLSREQPPRRPHPPTCSTT